MQKLTSFLRPITAAAMLGGLLLGPDSGQTATRTWDGSSSGIWATAANWSGGTAPVAGDDLVFPVGVTRTNMTNNFIPLRAFRSLTFLGSNYNLFGGTLILTNGVRVGALGTANNLPPTPNDIFSDIELRGAQTIIVSNLFTRLDLRGDVALGTHTLTSDGAGNVRFLGVVSGTGNLIKTGQGEMRLNGANSFSGVTIVSAGRLILGHDNALGAISSGTILSNATTLELLGNVCIPAEPLTINSTSSNPGALLSSAGSNFWDGPIELLRTAVINVTTNSRLDLGGIISGGPGLTKIGPGTLGFELKNNAQVTARDNSFFGTTRVLEGLLLAGRSRFLPEAAFFYDLVLPDALEIGDEASSAPAIVRFTGQEAIHAMSPVTIYSAGLMEINGFTVSIGSLIGEGEGAIILGRPGSTTAQFTVGNDNLASAFTGVISGSGSNFVKRGTGKLLLSGDNTYTAPTFVEGGTLQIDGVQPGSRVTVRTNASLSGRGFVGDLQVGNGGNVRPGASPGRLRATSTVLSNDAILHIELDGPIVGTRHDQLLTFGTLTLAGAKLLPTLSSFYTPIAGEVLTIIENNGIVPVAGSFDLLPNGSQLNIGGIPFRIHYNRGTHSNEVTLTIDALPLQSGSSGIGSGNGNARVDINECNFLSLGVSNATARTITNVVGTLSSPTRGVVVTEPLAFYGNIPGGRAATNTMPFQFFTTVGFDCGEEIEFHLAVTASNQTPFALRYKVPSGQHGTPLTFDNNTPVILFGNNDVNSTITVNGITGAVAKVTVAMLLNHTNLDELHITLTPPGPAGIPPVFTLARSLSGLQLGTNCSNGRVIFDDNGPLPITAGVAPYVGSFRPEDSLAELNGLSGSDVNGLWRLRILDDPGGGRGTLFCWSITITPAACAPGGGPCSICNGPFFGSLTTNDSVLRAIVEAPFPTRCNFNPCGPFFVTGSRMLPTDVYMFTNQGGPACLTVTLDAPCVEATNALVSSAVLHGPVVTNICPDLLGFSGRVTNSPMRYSFVAPSNSVFAVTVSGGIGGLLGFCSSYSVRVDGFDCPVPLGVEKDLSSNRIVLCWPTHGLDMSLERATNVPSPQWLAVTNIPIARGGRLIVTNNIVAPRQFYRLRK